VELAMYWCRERYSEVQENLAFTLGTGLVLRCFPMIIRAFLALFFGFGD